MHSYHHLHNRNSPLTSTYPLLFRDYRYAEFCAITNSVFSFCDESLVPRQHLTLGLPALAAGVRVHSSKPDAGRLLISSFTAEPEAPASTKAGALGWAVNTSPQDETKSTPREAEGVDLEQSYYALTICSAASSFRARL